MIFSFFIELMINAVVLSFVFVIFTKKSYRPEFVDIFYLATGISFTNIMLFMLLFPRIGYFTVIPTLAAGIWILMRFGGLAILHASAILLTYTVIRIILPF